MTREADTFVRRVIRQRKMQQQTFARVRRLLPHPCHPLDTHSFPLPRPIDQSRCPVSRANAIKSPKTSRSTTANPDRSPSPIQTRMNGRTSPTARAASLCARADLYLVTTGDTCAPDFTSSRNAPPQCSSCREFAPVMPNVLRARRALLSPLARLRLPRATGSPQPLTRRAPSRDARTNKPNFGQAPPNVQTSRRPWHSPLRSSTTLRSFLFDVRHQHIQRFEPSDRDV